MTEIPLCLNKAHVEMVADSFASDSSNVAHENVLKLLLDDVYSTMIFDNEKFNKIQRNDTNSSSSFENIINDNRDLCLEKRFTKKFISLIFEEDFEYGIESKSHLLVKEQMVINSFATKNWLNKIYVDNFNSTDVVIGLLRVISRFRREEIYPIGETIALASLSHKNELVQENAIRAFESWGGQSSLKILENVSVSSDWVNEYLRDVISDLKLEYAC